MNRKRNVPAVSAEWAMKEFPNARDAERAPLLKLGELRPGDIVLDLQAAGGYLSDGVYDYLEGDVSLICLEPCDELRARLSIKYYSVSDDVENWCSIADESVDVVLGLAGLHHSEDHQATIDEAYRVLKRGGRIVICDVENGSDMAKWLNCYVNMHNPCGHSGNFIKTGSLSKLFENSGFFSINETLRQVPWRFESFESAAKFFKGLFGIEKKEEEILLAMHEYLRLYKENDMFWVDWSLIYGIAVKK